MEKELVTSTKDFESKPLCLIVIGLAGSGKTSFVTALKGYLNEHDLPAYTINMDPAVHFVPFEPNIDIRDVIDYKETMKQYNIGPNGAILTSLNLFSTKMNDVVELIAKNTGLTNHVIIDTPGQIEVFKWSASGKVIIQSLSSNFPTAIIYVLDCSRSINPVVFLSNILYAAGVADEYQLPFVMAMNKCQITRCPSDITGFMVARAESAYCYQGIFCDGTAAWSLTTFSDFTVSVACYNFLTPKFFNLHGTYHQALG